MMREFIFGFLVMPLAIVAIGVLIVGLGYLLGLKSFPEINTGIVPGMFLSTAVMVLIAALLLSRITISTDVAPDRENQRTHEGEREIGRED